MKSKLFYILLFFFILFQMTFVKASVIRTKRNLNSNLRHESRCPVGCLECNGQRTCTKCQVEFTFYNGKCFDNKKLDSFIQDISENMEDKQKEILSFLINKKSDDQNNNKSMYIDINQDYNILKEMLKNIREWNVRECRMKINEFVMSFEKNMNVLLSLTHFFEEKSFFQIAKIKSKVLELLGNNKIEPTVKFDLVNKSLKEITDIINGIFVTINQKVEEYEKMSQGKIARYREYFYENFKKFFEKTELK